MKKLISFLLAAVLFCGTLSGCSASAPLISDIQTNAQSSAEDSQKEDGEPIVIRVGASITPHSEILKAADELLREKGYQLDIVEFDDYILPNLNVESGDLDANFFQHRPYLENFNEENGTHLVSVVVVHYEPFGLYPGKTTSLDNLADGAQIAIPNDGTNEARALLLLESFGLITLKEDIGMTATILDIEENPKNLQITEMAAAQLARSLQDVDMAVINGNYALAAGLKIADALASEDASGEAAQTYANIVAVRKADVDSAKTKALVAALTTQKVKDYINNTYNGAVVPIF